MINILCPTLNFVLQITLPSEITRSQDSVVNLLATGWKNWSLNSSRGKRFFTMTRLTLGPTKLLFIQYWGVLSECSTNMPNFRPFMMKSTHVITKGCGSARIVALWPMVVFLLLFKNCQFMIIIVIVIIIYLRSINPS